MERPDLEYRPANAADRPLLAEALLLNANAVRPSSVGEPQITGEPRFARYLNFPGDFDFGLIASTPDGPPVGVVWAIFSSEADPAAGYVADDIPEITITVLEGQRGLGIGYELLTEIEKEALRRGFKALSLWVEPGNRASSLYRRFGFVDVAGVFGEGTMLKKL